MQKLQELIPNDSELVIVFDRHVVIISVAVVYKHSHHLYCTWHLSQNIATHCDNKGGVTELFMKTTYTCKMSNFNISYEKLSYEKLINQIPKCGYVSREKQFVRQIV